MSTDLRIAMTTSLNDRLVAPLRRALDEIERSFRDLEKQTQATGQASEKAGQQLAGMQGPTKAVAAVDELARKTEQATSLAQRLERAWDKAGVVVRSVGAGMAAWQATKFVFDEPIRRVRNYEKQLADAANIAYPHGSRAQGMADMNAGVESAVAFGGGTREGALKGMNDLFAANIDKDVVKKLLPTVQMYSTAGNADPANIAQLVIYGLKTLKLAPEQIPLMLDKTLASTKQGSMEFDSLAKWMPQIGAAGSSAGLMGMKGYEYMLAGVQTSRLTAGTKDEAGTNFKDLLSLVNGHALMTAAKSIGIDATGSIAKHIGAGGNSLTGIVALADYVANSDPRFSAIDKKLKASGIQRDKTGAPIYTAEQEDLLRQQAMLFQGSALGKLFHNQQSMQSLVALRANRDFFQDQLNGTASAAGQIGRQDLETIQRTGWYKAQQQEQEELFAQTRALAVVNRELGNMATSTTELYRKYPELATVLESAKLGVNALATAAGAAAGVLGIFALLKGAPVAAAAGAAGAAAAGAAGTGVGAGLAARMAGLAWGSGIAVGAAGAAGYGAGTVLYNTTTGTRFGDEVGKLVAMIAAGVNGTGSQEAQQALERMAAFEGQMAAQNRELVDAIAKRPIVLQVDGRALATTVDDEFTWFSRRK